MTVEVEAPPAGSRLETKLATWGGRDRASSVPLGIPELRAALRRRRHFWMGAAVAGLLLGLVLHFALPKTYKAVSNLYLVEPPGSTASEAMANEVSLLQTRAIAKEAAASLPGHPDPQAVARSYKGLGLSGSILSISATARSPLGAVALGNAVGKAFLSVRSDQLTHEADVVLAGLQAQIAALQKSPNPDRLQISQLQGAERSAQITLRSATDGSFVLDPAQTVRSSSKKAVIEDAISGLIAGLGLGAGIVIVEEMVSDRARRREDVAEALGVEVELSLTRSTRWGRLRALAKRGERLDEAALVERRLRAHVDSVPSRSLAVFALDTEELAGRAIVSLGASMASDRTTVAVLDMGRGRPIAKRFHLDSRSGPVQPVEWNGSSLTVVIAPDDPAGCSDLIAREAVDTVLVLTSVDPAFGVDHVGGWAKDGVAVVRAGKTTLLAIDSAGRMVEQAGIRLRSAILVDADPHDETAGILCSRTPVSEGRPAVDAIPAGDW